MNVFFFLLNFLFAICGHVHVLFVLDFRDGLVDVIMCIFFFSKFIYFYFVQSKFQLGISLSLSLSYEEVALMWNFLYATWFSFIQRLKKKNSLFLMWDVSFSEGIFPCCACEISCSRLGSLLVLNGEK